MKIHAAIAFAAAALTFAPSLSAAPAPVRLYVSTQGRDSWSGRLPAPNAHESDGPLASLEAARDAARALRRSGKIGGRQILVYLRGGTYPLESSFVLEKRDGGSKAAPVVYCNYNGESVRVSGGRQVTNFVPVTDAAILARLAPAARPKVCRADLRAIGITNFGQMTRRGFGSPIVPAGLELFFQDRPMTLASYPNEGWLTITEAPEGQQGSKFRFDDARPSGWKPDDDIWVHGYWSYDWADSYQKVAALDAAGRLVTTSAPHGVYGYTPGKRFRFINVLEELDQPGEWYLDRSSGILYFWPPAPVSSSRAFVSILEEPLVVLKDAPNLTIRGINFECTRGCGIEVMGGERVEIAGCTIRNIGTVGVSFGGDIGDIHQRLYDQTKHQVGAGSHSGIRNCLIYETGDGGILLGGGDRKTLTPAYNYAVNNHIHHFQRWSRTYRPAVSLNGVGNRVANNLIHDAPHMGIGLSGNDHIIEYNELHHVCLETGDAGAFYMGRDWSMRGNIVRCNYFHDLSGVKGQKGFTDVMAVYLDDWSSGTLVAGNLFVRAGRAILVGGGRDNTIANNIFVDCNPAIHVDQRGLGWAKYYFDGSTNTLFDRLKAVNHDKPPYSRRYPKLADILEDEPVLAKGNRITDNIRAGGRWTAFADGADKVVFLQNNYVEGDPLFVDAAKGDYRLKHESPALKLGIRPLPYEKMGLQAKTGAP